MNDDRLEKELLPFSRESLPAQPLLQLRDAVVRRQGKEILSVNELSLEAGQSVVLLGPNGAGKTTFVNLITREVQPLHRDQPPVVFKGNPRIPLSEVQASLGMVSASMQEQIHVHLPSLDVVTGGLFDTLGIHRRFTVEDHHRARALEVMEELGIADLADRDIMTLSSGQARRVLIARALVNEPDALIMDEPCAGLDPEGMFFVRRTMRHLARSGCSIILVTHYLEDVIPEMDRIILIKEGVIYADGGKEEILTDEMMRGLFEIPVHVRRDGDYYHLVEEY